MGLMEILSVLGILAIVYVLGAIITFAIFISDMYIESCGSDLIEMIFMAIGLIFVIAGAAFWPIVLCVAITQKFKKD
jgi:DMSO/TMAO reductase YedYZ heme-binding membrane subunit